MTIRLYSKYLFLINRLVSFVSDDTVVELQETGQGKALMHNPECYTYRVQWSPEDDEYVGLCAEFPGLSHLDDTMTAALLGIADLVKSLVNDMDKAGEEPPEPINKRRYSGQQKIQLQKGTMPPTAQPYPEKHDYKKGVAAPVG